ncbi:putative Phytocyanin domain, cupredoxin [Helianthus anomalus]
MAEGRGGAGVAMAVICLLVVALQCEAASFVVGDKAGWTMNIAGWEKGKTFKAGDTLVFNYPKGQHNVVVKKDPDDISMCSLHPEDKEYKSGKDTITLNKGSNYIICSFRHHCPKMKLYINASWPI